MKNLDLHNSDAALTEKAFFSCDVNSANLFFLQNQGKIAVYQNKDFVFRHYEGKEKNRNGWLFPNEYLLQSADQDSTLKFKSYLQNLLEIEPSPNFILLTEEQKNFLCSNIKKFFPEYQSALLSDEGDSDYIYIVENMAKLPGKIFQKKRNHVNKFKKNYGDDWDFVFFDSKTINQQNLSSIQKIYNQWKKDNSFTENEFLVSEEKSLGLLAKTDIFEKLNLIAGLLYVLNKPSAFLVASFTTEECLNIHFEKCTAEVSDNGGPAFLNQQFAQTVSEKYPECKYLNREEDLNIPGLRKSKLSYKPEFLIKKYYGEIKRN